MQTDPQTATAGAAATTTGTAVAEQKPKRGRREGSSNPQAMAEVTPGFGSLAGFDLIQRAAKLLTSSTLVPAAYRDFIEVKEYGKVKGYTENPNGFSNCVVALNMAQRMKADPLMIMQNLYIVEGRPAWSAQYIIAAINSCGRYSPLRFELSAPGEPQAVEYTENEWNDGKKSRVKKSMTCRDQTCFAYAVEKETGEVLRGPTISIAMAVAEGWMQKNGSKWQTMPEVMLRYRAASFFGKLYAPELLMGIEGEHDVIDLNATEWAVVEPAATRSAPAAPGLDGLAAAIQRAPAGAENEPETEQQPEAKAAAEGSAGAAQGGAAAPAGEKAPPPQAQGTAAAGAAPASGSGKKNPPPPPGGFGKVE